MAEVEQPGASFADVARRHDVSRSLLWNWRGQVRRVELVPEPMLTFMPVQITADTLTAAQAPVQVAAPAEAARVEIALPDGTCIQMGADIGLATLRRVTTAVRR